MKCPDCQTIGHAYEQQAKKSYINAPWASQRAGERIAAKNCESSQKTDKWGTPK
jgi:hypothetical protein